MAPWSAGSLRDGRADVPSMASAPRPRRRRGVGARGPISALDLEGDGRRHRARVARVPRVRGGDGVGRGGRVGHRARGLSAVDGLGRAPAGWWRRRRRRRRCPVGAGPRARQRRRDIGDEGDGPTPEGDERARTSPRSRWPPAAPGPGSSATPALRSRASAATPPPPAGCRTSRARTVNGGQHHRGRPPGGEVDGALHQHGVGLAPLHGVASPPSSTPSSSTLPWLASTTWATSAGRGRGHERRPARHGGGVGDDGEDGEAVHRGQRARARHRRDEPADGVRREEPGSPHPHRRRAAAAEPGARRSARRHARPRRVGGPQRAPRRAHGRGGGRASSTAPSPVRPPTTPSSARPQRRDRGGPVRDRRRAPRRRSDGSGGVMAAVAALAGSAVSCHEGVEVEEERDPAERARVAQERDTSAAPDAFDVRHQRLRPAPRSRGPRCAGRGPRRSRSGPPPLTARTTTTADSGHGDGQPQPGPAPAPAVARADVAPRASVDVAPRPSAATLLAPATVGTRARAPGMTKAPATHPPLHSPPVPESTPPAPPPVFERADIRKKSPQTDDAAPPARRRGGGGRHRRHRRCRHRLRRVPQPPDPPRQGGQPRGRSHPRGSRTSSWWGPRHGAPSSSRTRPSACARKGVTGVNSDVVMILHVDPNKKTAAILSIPRDLFVPNARATGANKIDAALVEGPAAAGDRHRGGLRDPHPPLRGAQLRQLPGRGQRPGRDQDVLPRARLRRLLGPQRAHRRAAARSTGSRRWRWCGPGTCSTRARASRPTTTPTGPRTPRAT